MAKSVGKWGASALPPIPVKEAQIKLSVPPALRDDVELFGAFFEELAGEAPASASAVYVGILSAYLGSHPEFQQWKAGRRAPRTPMEAGGDPSSEASGGPSMAIPAVAA